MQLYEGTIRKYDRPGGIITAEEMMVIIKATGGQRTLSTEEIHQRAKSRLVRAHRDEHHVNIAKWREKGYSYHNAKSRSHTDLTRTYRDEYHEYIRQIEVDLMEITE